MSRACHILTWFGWLFCLAVLPGMTSVQMPGAPLSLGAPSPEIQELEGLPGNLDELGSDDVLELCKVLPTQVMRQEWVIRRVQAKLRAQAADLDELGRRLAWTDELMRALKGGAGAYGLRDASMTSETVDDYRTNYLARHYIEVSIQSVSFQGGEFPEGEQVKLPLKVKLVAAYEGTPLVRDVQLNCEINRGEAFPVETSIPGPNAEWDVGTDISIDGEGDQVLTLSLKAQEDLEGLIVHFRAPEPMMAPVTRTRLNPPPPPQEDQCQIALRKDVESPDIQGLVACRIDCYGKLPPDLQRLLDWNLGITSEAPDGQTNPVVRALPCKTPTLDVAVAQGDVVGECVKFLRAASQYKAAKVGLDRTGDALDVNISSDGKGLEFTSMHTLMTRRRVSKLSVPTAAYDVVVELVCDGDRTYGVVLQREDWKSGSYYKPTTIDCAVDEIAANLERLSKDKINVIICPDSFMPEAYENIMKKCPQAKVKPCLAAFSDNNNPWDTGRVNLFDLRVSIPPGTQGKE